MRTLNANNFLLWGAIKYVLHYLFYHYCFCDFGIDCELAEGFERINNNQLKR